MTWKSIHLYTVLKTSINSPISNFRHIICIFISVALQYQVINHQLYNSTCNEAIVSSFLIYEYLWSILGNYRLLLRMLWNKVIISCWCHVTASFPALHILKTLHRDDELRTYWRVKCFHFKLFFLIWSYYFNFLYCSILLYKNIKLHINISEFEREFIHF